MPVAFMVHRYLLSISEQQICISNSKSIVDCSNVRIVFLTSITGVLGGTNFVSCPMLLSYCVCDVFLVLLSKSQIIFAIMPI